MSGESPDRQDDRKSFSEELCRIISDPAVRRLARQRAGSADLAEDALQETFYSVARVRDPGSIRNLEGYVRRSLVHHIRGLRQRGALPIEDPCTVAERRPDSVVGPAVPRPVDEDVVSRVRARQWRQRLLVSRQAVRARVPGRSGDPERYREAIVAAAEGILGASCAEPGTPPEFDAALAEQYPEWFAGPAVSANTRHQRLSRGRSDVRDVLRAIVSRDELRAS